MYSSHYAESLPPMYFEPNEFDLNIPSDPVVKPLVRIRSFRLPPPSFCTEESATKPNTSRINDLEDKIEFLLKDVEGEGNVGNARSRYAADSMNRLERTKTNPSRKSLSFTGLKRISSFASNMSKPERKFKKSKEKEEEEALSYYYRAETPESDLDLDNMNQLRLQPTFSPISIQREGVMKPLPALPLVIGKKRSILSFFRISRDGVEV